MHIKTKVDKVLKKSKKKEIRQEEKKELNKKYAKWHKNNYNPFFDYYSFREDVKK
jgi:hypothetical protein